MITARALICIPLILILKKILNSSMIIKASELFIHIFFLITQPATTTSSATSITATITTATPTTVTASKPSEELNLPERRPSWRLKVDNGSKVCDIFFCCLI